jgi:hypothetical protein
LEKAEIFLTRMSLEFFCVGDGSGNDAGVFSFDEREECQ